MKAEETFSSLKKTIKSKFISEGAITEEDRAKEPEPQKPEEDVRPLYYILRDNKIKSEEEFEDQFRLSKRIKTLDEEEYEFYSNIEEQERKRIQEIKKMEQKSLDEFRKDAEFARDRSLVASTASSQPAAAGNRKRDEPAPKNTKPKAALVKRKNETAKGRKETEPAADKKTIPEKNLLVAYGSSSDDD
ncbi:hypothetical protein HDV03_001231 [Kappamyces sp. JEL0829]|nr:hypothetical protein HDV03_001231 [Kappamyces sp. JEL0829]